MSKNSDINISAPNVSPPDSRPVYRRSQWEVTSQNAHHWWQEISPSQLFVGSFLFLIMLATILLQTMPGLYTGAPLGFLDSLFTAASAICVTGLIVVDTATYFTPLGQAFILLLIQLGGLGMLTFTSLIIVAFGKRLSVRQESIYVPTSGVVGPTIDASRLVRDIILFTFSIELLGVAFLWYAFCEVMPWQNALWPAIFHSVSAFCNAGFSIFSDSLIQVSHSAEVLMPVSFLIVLGGIGFLTLEEVSLLWMHPKGKKVRLSLQSRIILLTTLLLLIAGTVAFLFLEWNGIFAQMDTGTSFLNAFFMSVTSRTAGFNAINYAAASDASNFFTIILMMIGGSPGSTAGGLKTTTFFLIGLLAWARIRGDSEATVFFRSIRQETMGRAVGLFVIGFGIVTLAVLLLAVFETGATSNNSFLFLLFEVVSAFNTVGLSIGTTAALSYPSKCVIIFLMIIGRVGPLVFAAALFMRSRKKHEFRYSFEDVVVG